MKCKCFKFQKAGQSQNGKGSSVHGVHAIESKAKYQFMYLSQSMFFSKSKISVYVLIQIYIFHQKIIFIIKHIKKFKLKNDNQRKEENIITGSNLHN